MTDTTLELLQKYESRNVTFIDPAGDWPIVWQRASGVHVWDSNRKKYLDLTSAFGVAAAGHANTAVVKAGQEQMKQLLHAMSDVHPHLAKAELAQALSKLTFERWSAHTSPGRPVSGKTIFCSSGFEAVEAALKTAFLVSGRPNIVAFEGGYHGLGYGALNVTHRQHFRSPFRRQLAEFGHHVAFPETSDQIDAVEESIRGLCAANPVGAIILEPVQVRAGVRVPPLEFLPRLRILCDELDLLLILDEIYTGFGRTGKWFACEHTGTIPDLVCLGKALAGGFPLSACVGRADLMDEGWPPASGDPIHTSTFLGHPVGCAMALAQIQEIERRDLVKRSEDIGLVLRRALMALKPPKGIAFKVRTTGLLAGIECLTDDGQPATEFSLATVKRLLNAGFIALPDGEHANVIGLAPPLTIAKRQVMSAVEALQQAATATCAISTEKHSME
jgi:4-aminobutyrate aminotransferase-like enzyme